MTHDAQPATAEDQPIVERRRGPDPLSAGTRRCLLGRLLAAAEAGDTAAASALVELSLAAERDQQLAETLRQLRGEGDAP